jgi:excisionase family DNA binding protein
MPKILRPLELAKALHVSDRLIRKWQADKVIPYVKIGRVTLFDEDKVLAALAKFERKEGVSR